MFKLEYNVIYIKENLCITYIFFYWIDCLYCPCIVSFELVQWPALIFAANLQPFFCRGFFFPVTRERAGAL